MIAQVGCDWPASRLHRRDFLFQHSYNNLQESLFHSSDLCAGERLLSYSGRSSLPLYPSASLCPVALRLLPPMSQSPAERAIEEDDKTEAPLTMAASVVLTNLPRDASKALETAGNLGIEKSKHQTCLYEVLLQHVNLATVTVRLQPIGSAPHLNQRVFKLSTNQRFETIVRFLRKRLGAKEHESVFCYVGSVFSPALDEGVGNLWTVSWPYVRSDESIVR
jgi:ubiquitin-like protein ATG12